jgi:bacillithiol system protein YtxJ
MFFKKSPTNQNFNNHWIHLNELAQLEDIITLSYKQNIVIFKHSTRCSISIMGLKSFERNFDFKNKNYQSYFLDLLSYRNISNEISNKFNVIHQSPQVLVIVNGLCNIHASHESISEMVFS